MTKTQDRPPVASGLTHGEVGVLTLLATGATTESTARRLGISGRTVRRRVRRVCDRLGVDTTVQALTWAARNGLI